MRSKLVSTMLMLAGLLAVTVAFVYAQTPQPRKKPSEDWALHIDAKLHFIGKPEVLAHHYCKTGIAGGLIECQLYDSDEPNARLVGVEVIVTPATYQSFSAREKALWHHHKEEIPKASATLPDLSPEEGAKVVQSIENTYGKIYLLWDPTQSEVPTGQPVAFADSTRVRKK